MAKYHADFNSRPCERGDIVPGVWVFGWRDISIPAPARGATAKDAYGGDQYHDFNSRPCERGDPYNRKFKGLFVISIPAPARGATICLLSTMPRRGYFNSRPCERGDSNTLQKWFCKVQLF